MSRHATSLTTHVLAALRRGTGCQPVGSSSTGFQPVSFSWHGLPAREFRVARAASPCVSYFASHGQRPAPTTPQGTALGIHPTPPQALKRRPTPCPHPAALALATLLLAATTNALSQTAPAPLPRIDPTATVAAARAQIGVTTSYDPAYRKLAYPGGDVRPDTGVCADVIIRALRKQNADLQQLVHEDMAKNFSSYPKIWGLNAPDKNIDHRRVPNLCAYFTRAGKAVPITDKSDDYKPGDIVAWNLRSTGSLPHIGIVSDKKAGDGTPLIIHNIGQGACEENILFRYKITGHFRLQPATQAHNPARQEAPPTARSARDPTP